MSSRSKNQAVARPTKQGNKAAAPVAIARALSSRKGKTTQHAAAAVVEEEEDDEDLVDQGLDDTLDDDAIDNEDESDIESFAEDDDDALVDDDGVSTNAQAADASNDNGD